MDFNQLNDIYNKAEAEKSFKSLVPFPKLMYRWQIRHPDDRLRIATLASHKLGHHVWCGDKCDIINKFIWENSNPTPALI